MGTYHVVGHIDKIVELDVEARNEENAWDEFCGQAADEITRLDWRKKGLTRMPRSDEPGEWELVDALMEPEKMGKWKLSPSHCVGIGRVPVTMLVPTLRPKAQLSKYVDITVGNHNYSLAQISEGLEEFGADVKGILPEFFILYSESALLIIKPVPEDLYLIIAERAAG